MNKLNYCVITVSGMISHFAPSHTHKGINFYEGYIETRAGKKEVRLPIIIREDMFDVSKENIKVSINGSVRTNESSGFTRLFIYVDSIEETESLYYFNEVRIKGHLCRKNPVYQHQGDERRSIIYKLAVNKVYGATKYLPCKSFSLNTNKIDSANLGDVVTGTGSMSSFYDRRIGKTKYELRLLNIDVEEENNAN